MFNKYLAKLDNREKYASVSLSSESIRREYNFVIACSTNADVAKSIVSACLTLSSNSRSN